LNFLRKTITFTTKPIPQVIVISDLEEDMQVGIQLVVEEQLQLVFALRLVEEEELQQPVVQEQPQPIFASRHVEEKELQLVSSGEVFL
jgi:hypothetical protein